MRGELERFGPLHGPPFDSPPWCPTCGDTKTVVVEHDVFPVLAVCPWVLDTACHPYRMKHLAGDPF